MTLPTSDPQYVALIIRTESAETITTKLVELRAAFDSGATTVTMAGLSGTVDRDGLAQTLANYIAASEAKAIASGTIDREDITTEPMGMTVNFAGRPIQL